MERERERERGGGGGGGGMEEEGLLKAKEMNAVDV